MSTNLPHGADSSRYTQPLNPASIAGLAVSVVLCVLIGMYSDVAWLMLTGGALAILLMPWARSISLLFIVMLVGLCFFLDRNPWRLGSFNVYASDFVLVLYFWCFVHASLQGLDGSPRPVRRPLERTLTALWITWCVLGIFFVLHGLAAAYAFDRVFGDFRRSTIYVMAFFLPLLFPYTHRHLRHMNWAVFAGGILLVGIGAFRLATGIVARVDENYETGHLGTRLMGMPETLGLVGLLAVLTVFFKQERNVFIRMAVAVAVVPCVALLVLSGFRLAMAFAVFVPVATIFFLVWANRENIGKLAFNLLIFFALAIPLVLLITILLPEQFDRMTLDLRLRLMNQNVQGGFRWWTYEAAMQRFLERPLFGHGFGYYLVVPTRNQVGVFDYVEMNNPHNMFLGVLYQTGLLGFIPFVMFHVMFFANALRSLRNIAQAYIPVYVALLTTYLSYLAYMSLQPYESSAFIIMYFIMGFMLRLTRASEEPRIAPATD